MPALHSAFAALAKALLIGLLVGFQREASQTERQAGFRDFILIALTGGVCGLADSPWLTVAALLSIAILLAVFHFQVRERTGITTEMTAVATFCLSYLTTTPHFASGASLAIGATVVMVAFLEAKRAAERLIRETITEAEFNDTLRFLAIIFIIYPLLPEDSFGPYGFFAPRKIWLFVILVSSISYAGYFLQKFPGAERGLALTGLMGGLASTTAATTAFGRGCSDEPQYLPAYWRATILANAVQFPRVIILLFVLNWRLGVSTVAPLAAACAAGLMMAWLLSRGPRLQPEGAHVPVGNPFRLAPALKFGAIFTAVLLGAKAAAAEAGGRGILWIGLLGGSIDVDAVVVTAAEMAGPEGMCLGVERQAVLLALVANAVLKTVLAAWAGGLAFGWRVAAGFLAMFGAAGAALAWLG